MARHSLRDFPPDEISAQRQVAPNLFLQRVMPNLLEFGITRIASQTGFDRLGVPVCAAFRPDARSLAVTQGKGLTQDSAKVSAVMEAIEFAVAEVPEIEKVVMPHGALDDSNRFVDFDFLLKFPEQEKSEMLTCLEGIDLLSAEKTWCPLDALDFNSFDSEIPNICKNTNGLASGERKDEAVCHAICELIERDAETLWWLRDDEYKISSLANPLIFQNQMVDFLVDLISEAGMVLKLFDITSDIEVPTYLCFIFDPKNHVHSVIYGSATHPEKAVAAAKSILEAIQSRIGWITGARDDLKVSEFGKPLTNFETQAMQSFEPKLTVSNQSHPYHADISSVPYLSEALEAADVTDVGVFELSGKNRPFSVVKAISRSLEDREPNFHWRPGHRAMEVLAA